MTPRILMTQCRRPVPTWRHYSVVTDGRVAIVDMVPALWGGWNIRAVTVQGADAWGGYDAAAIVEWKTANAHDFAPIAEVDPASLEPFLPRLLSVAAAGEVTP